MLIHTDHQSWAILIFLMLNYQLWNDLNVHGNSLTLIVFKPGKPWKHLSFKMKAAWLVLVFQVQSMRFGTYMGKYRLLLWALYGFGFFNFNSKLLRCGSHKIHIIWYQNYHYVSWLQLYDTDSNTNIVVFAQGYQGVSV